jgi:hypothetical protein
MQAAPGAGGEWVRGAIAIAVLLALLAIESARLAG